MTIKPKIYLAGPECFMPDGKQRADQALALCEKYGFEGISPAKGNAGEPVDFSNPDRQRVARDICKKNMWCIEQCDIIIANTNNFRGFEPDGGTAFELGYGWALGKKLYCFLDDIRSCEDKYTGVQIPDKNNVLRDENGLTFESGPLNLMLDDSSTVIEGGIEDALKRAAADFGTAEGK
ncbi:MAG: nucleoside 2-deoxyribosyltransferase [Oscillospiraceae bacterium]